MVIYLHYTASKTQINVILIDPCAWYTSKYSSSCDCVLNCTDLKILLGVSVQNICQGENVHYFVCLKSPNLSKRKDICSKSHTSYSVFKCMHQTCIIMVLYCDLIKINK